MKNNYKKDLIEIAKKRIKNQVDNREYDKAIDMLYQLKREDR